MEEKRNFVGLKSWKKEQLTPFKDVKNEGTGKERVALANSLNRIFLTPLTTCCLEEEEGVFILDGVQRWKMLPNNTFVRCYHIGTVSKKDAIKYWFMLDIRLEDNILKVMYMLNDLDLELLTEVAKCSKYDAADFADFKKLIEFDWQKYLKKISTNQPVQTTLFDSNEE